MSKKNNELELVLEQRDAGIAELLSVQEQKNRSFFDCLENYTEKKELNSSKIFSQSHAHIGKVNLR